MDQPPLLFGGSGFQLETAILCTAIDFDEADLTNFMAVSDFRLLIREYILSTDDQKRRCRSDFSQPWQWLCHHKLVGTVRATPRPKQPEARPEPPRRPEPGKESDAKMEGIDDLKKQWQEEIRTRRRERKMLQRASKKEARGLPTEEEDFMEEVFLRRQLVMGDGIEAHARKNLTSDDRIAWEQAELDARVLYRLLVEVESPDHPMHGKYVTAYDDDGGLARQKRVAECLWKLWTFVVEQVEARDPEWIRNLELEKVLNPSETRNAPAPLNAEERLRLAKDRAARAERRSRRWNTEEEDADLEVANMLKASLSGMQM